MTSETQTSYRSVFPRHGRSRRLVSYQPRSAFENPSVPVAGACVISGLRSLTYQVLRYSWQNGSVRDHSRTVLLFFCMFITIVPVRAQWQIIADGQPWSWLPNGSIDSTLTVEEQVTRMFHQEGYLYAVIDSQNTYTQTLFISLGKRAQVGEVTVRGRNPVDSFPLNRGDWITSSSLEQAAKAILDQYSEDGYLLAEVVIEAIIPRDSVQHDVILHVYEGNPVRLERIVLQGARRTKAAYAHHVSGLTSGQPLKNFDMEEIQRKLEATGLFSRVGLPVLYKAAEHTVFIHMQVTESPPGVFDMALGYERTEGGKGALVGSGRLALRHLFGRGRTLELTLNRAPGQLGYVRVNADTPLLFGLPLNLSASFEGLQQDSTYGKRDYGIQLGYWLRPSMQIFASASYEVTRPGLTGTEIVQGRQRIPIADALYFGGGIQIRQVDHALNPTRGYLLTMHAERGQKDVERGTLVAGYEEHQLYQSRLTVQGRMYIPLHQRSLLATGGELMLVRSRNLDESDLFRIGGAKSLRGYDEQRFRASFATRVLVEFRYLLDRETYGFGFFDLGYLDNQDDAGFPSGWYPGFGMGFQIHTAAGLINVTFASTTEDVSAVRAHIGLSLGL